MLHSILLLLILKTLKRVTENTSIRYDTTYILDFRDIQVLHLQFSKQRFIREGVNGNVHKILNLDNDEKGSAGYKGRRSRISRMATSVDVNGVELSKMQFDSTGMFHWCPSRELGSCLMDRQEAAMTVLQVGEGTMYYLHMAELSL